ncbi:AAA family ATPase [Bacteroides fragilis]|uniref:AAA family ATPase n=1 Tax=Bacteroides fragilis TaxID=817 RepID=UPI001CE04FA2|nr:AAA family ATPase [Bacteroides fragilis]MCA5613214.1 AAA family ATPase [Bacteroides fragilis]
MKILTIRLKNLASIEGTFEIDFQAEPLRSAGIFAISGPTGAGKSTILDALCLALYDKTPRFSASVESLYMSDIGESRVNQADVKNILRRGTGEGFAEVDFLGASGHCYRSRWSVRRTGSRANGALRSQTIQVTDLTANQELQGTRKELLAQLVTLVGLTYEQFTRTVLLAQNDFATFLKSRESAKAELLEKLTGTEIYSRISSEIYLRSKTADAELNQLKSNATLIELLSEEEITLLRTEKESLTNLREQGSKALIDLNAQLSVLHTLKLQQEQRDKKVQDMRLDEEKSKKLREEYTRQSDSLIRFRGQCEAVQPDLSRARELDVQIQSLVSQSKQVEEILQGAEKAANAQANKLQSVQGALHTSCHSLKNLTGEIELPVTEETGLFLESVRNRLKEQEDQLAILQEKNEARVNRLNAFGIEAVTDEQARWMQEQTRLQNARQQMLEWRKAGTEAERLKAQQEEMGHKQEQMRKEITLLTTRLSEKEAELKVLQRLFENARIAMGKDVRTLRQNLRENEPCPVCGGTDHPYRNEEQVVHSLYQNIEQEYQTASAEYQQLNNRNIALKQDLLHLSELSGEITVQLQAFLQEAEQKRPSSEEEQNPDYFEKQLHTVQGKLNLLAEKMHQYHQLYKEWQQHEGQIRTVRSACEALREGVARCHLLMQQVLAAKEQFELLKTAETTAREQFRVVSEQLITLRQERAPLLKGKSVEDAEAAIRKKEKQLNDSVEQVRKEGEEVQSRISGMQGEIRQLNSSIDELMLRKEQIADPEHLPETIARQQATNQETERRLSTVEARLLQQEQNRKKLKQLEQELTEKQEIANRWGKLNKLIGSADGTKFKVIAQSYTLNLLLMHANKHLSYLSKRYRLQQVPGTLALQVIDCDMCDEVRTVYSLSGGESFLISLALALGLSSLSSNNLKVESLFIDEGFGSLDADSLRTVMEALEQLQMQGRKIGVISHVQEMSERIAVQVQLHRAANGKSAITLTN